MNCELSYLCVAGDDAGHLVGKDGIAGVALPVLQVVAQCDADALSLEVVSGVDAASIVEHDKTLAEATAGVVVDGALVLHQLLPPLGVAVGDAEHGF